MASKDETSSSSNFFFVEVNLGESASDKLQRISRVRSHITTKFYSERREDQQHNVKSQRDHAKIIRPKKGAKKAGLGKGVIATKDENQLKDNSIKALMLQQKTAAAAIRSFVMQPGISRLDPFDALPVKGDVRIDRTIQMWRTSPAPNLTPHTGIHYWGSFAGERHSWREEILSEDDQLLFYLRLFAASFWCDRLLARDDSVETTYFRSAVLQGTRKRVSEESSSLSTILVISHLAINTGISGRWEETEIHLSAVRRLVKMRGGFFTLPLPMRRVIFWNEFNAGAIFQRGPRWPVDLVEDPNPGALPKEFLEMVEARRACSKSRFPPGIDYPENLMRSLHILSVMDCKWPYLATHPAISNEFFRYMHSYYRAVTSQSIREGTSDEDVILKSLYWASRLYIKSTLGFFGYHPIYSVWILRMKRVLEESDGFVLWYRSSGLDLLLWILFVAAVHSTEVPPIHQWFVVQLRYALAVRRIDDLKTFETILRDFPWASAFSERCKDIWDILSKPNDDDSIHPFGSSHMHKLAHNLLPTSCIEPASRMFKSFNARYDI